MGFFVVIINAIAICMTSFIAPIKIATVAEPTLPVDHRRGGAVHGPVDGHGCGPRPQSAGPRRRSEPRASGASSNRCRRRDATSIIENLRLQQVYNAIYTTSLDIALADTPVGPIRRWFARVVLGDKDELVDADRTGSGSWRCSSSSARPT